jgi:uroporphyrinogen-III synthase
MVGFLLKTFPSADVAEEIDPMHPIQNTHIAAILKLTAQQLEALRIPPEIQKEYSEILALREKIKRATHQKKARRQFLARCLPRA